MTERQDKIEKKEVVVVVGGEIQREVGIVSLLEQEDMRVGRKEDNQRSQRLTGEVHFVEKVEQKMSCQCMKSLREGNCTGWALRPLKLAEGQDHLFVISNQSLAWPLSLENNKEKNCKIIWSIRPFPILNERASEQFLKKLTYERRLLWPPL